jgi:hypothetical protein
LNAMRVLCYTDKRRYLEVESYIQYVIAEHDVELRAEHVLKDSNGDELLPYKMLNTLYLTPAKIEFLLYGLENECGPEVVPQDRTCSDALRQFNIVNESIFGSQGFKFI